MGLAEYFATHRPVAKWSFGERVIGKFHGIPFVGTTGGEGMVNETEGSLVTVFIDLPIKHNNIWHTTFIKVRPGAIKKLNALEAERSKHEPLKLKVAGSTPVKRTKIKKDKDVSYD